MVPDFHPQFLNLIVTASQSQLFRLYPSLNVEGNSPTPPCLPIPSEKLVALDSCASVILRPFSVTSSLKLGNQPSQLASQNSFTPHAQFHSIWCPHTSLGRVQDHRIQSLDHDTIHTTSHLSDLFSSFLGPRCQMGGQKRTLPMCSDPFSVFPRNSKLLNVLQFPCFSFLWPNLKENE